MATDDPRRRTVAVTAVDGEFRAELADVVAVEEPLEIRLATRDATERVAITMRTPGDDFSLAVGFLANEGILVDPHQVIDVSYCLDGHDGSQPASTTAHLTQQKNVVTVTIDGAMPDLHHLERRGTITSACGVCGRTALESLRIQSDPMDATAGPHVELGVLHGLPMTLRREQAVFEATGGLHAAGIFDLGGDLLDLREDVGRHNALDKLVGNAFRRGAVPWEHRVLLLSGRASYELLAKAVAVQVPIVAAVGAPSSLAVDVAHDFGITLVGFLRDDRCNVYTHPARVTVAGAALQPGPVVAADRQDAGREDSGRPDADRPEVGR